MLRCFASLLLLSGLCSAGCGLPVATANEVLPVDLWPELREGWRETQTLAAPQAHQAAAADERHLYVINNTTVTAYDRHSGQPVWTSRGGNATHLNSGFVDNGRLYCAHSNYPRQPATSQIKVVDLATGEMTDFKDFGVSDGSLTWAVRHDGAWWCNFAYYGAQQKKTQLVRYDDRWQQTGSWTYPTALISLLGRHSLSGGIWYGDTLLVTDHDHPVIYRLRLPEQGRTLQWIDRRQVPFTGQGFAIDPLVTATAKEQELPAGLVGINRAQRRVVLAELPSPVNAPAERLE